MTDDGKKQGDRLERHDEAKEKAKQLQDPVSSAADTNSEDTDSLDGRVEDEFSSSVRNPYFAQITNLDDDDGLGKARPSASHLTQTLSQPHVDNLPVIGESSDDDLFASGSDGEGDAIAATANAAQVGGASEPVSVTENDGGHNAPDSPVDDQLNDLAELPTELEGLVPQDTEEDELDDGPGEAGKSSARAGPMTRKQVEKSTNNVEQVGTSGSLSQENDKEGTGEQEKDVNSAEEGTDDSDAFRRVRNYVR